MEITINIYHNAIAHFLKIFSYMVESFSIISEIFFKNILENLGLIWHFGLHFQNLKILDTVILFFFVDIFQ